jgi:hypothetical protein
MKLSLTMLLAGSTLLTSAFAADLPLMSHVSTSHLSTQPIMTAAGLCQITLVNKMNYTVYVTGRTENGISGNFALFPYLTGYVSLFNGYCAARIFLDIPQSNFHNWVPVNHTVTIAPLLGGNVQPSVEVKA